jgi:hypothetical protein
MEKVSCWWIFKFLLLLWETKRISIVQAPSQFQYFTSIIWKMQRWQHLAHNKVRELLGIIYVCIEYNFRLNQTGRYHHHVHRQWSPLPATCRTRAPTSGTLLWITLHVWSVQVVCNSPSMVSLMRLVRVGLMLMYHKFFSLVSIRCCWSLQTTSAAVHILTWRAQVHGGDVLTL